MRIFFICFFALCLCGQSAMALDKKHFVIPESARKLMEEQRKQEEKIYEKGAANQALKSEFRHCATDGDCTNAKNFCDRCLAVSKSSKNEIEAILSKLEYVCMGPLLECDKVSCIKGLCEAKIKYPH